MFKLLLIIFSFITLVRTSSIAENKTGFKEPVNLSVGYKQNNL